ncbi:Maf family protein [Oceanobacillus chungangensis]|uniref:dTTP/UTP pyrophosphatase n=1 Tax=Oceanobacillus chungangensis TaxID=1229152 RepID=A0A3D8PKC3_9BACI|nr:Maf family protein [Oceanobacillus chungangensis]RDW15937.1 septum formation protein Maf [Oceanobacillus chungangensis]
MTKKLILASSSPRRQELLRQVKIPFAFRKQDIDESLIITSDPLKKVKQLSQLKGQSILIEHKDEVIISADTVVTYNQRIFEKPKNKEDALQMLSALSGDVHEVFTGVMIRSVDEEIVFVERTKVEFWQLTKEEIEWYISTNEPYDKAGAYGIQSIGATFVKQIIGDYYNVMGLPISRVVRELREFEVYPETALLN